jgi:hypothetical protein
MGVTMLSKSSFFFFTLFMHVQVLSGARPALPIGVAPEAIVKNMFRVQAQINHFFFDHQVIALFDNIIGCAASAPDGSSPRGYSRIFSGID